MNIKLELTEIEKKHLKDGLEYAIDADECYLEGEGDEIIDGVNYWESRIESMRKLLIAINEAE